MDIDCEAFNGSGIARELLAVVVDLRLWFPDRYQGIDSVCEHQALLAIAVRLGPGAAAVLLLGAGAVAVAVGRLCKYVECMRAGREGEGAGAGTTGPR